MCWQTSWSFGVIVGNRGILQFMADICQNHISFRSNSMAHGSGVCSSVCSWCVKPVKTVIFFLPPVLQHASQWSIVFYNRLQTPHSEAHRRDSTRVLLWHARLDASGSRCKIHMRIINDSNMFCVQNKKHWQVKLRDVNYISFYSGSWQSLSVNLTM